jgi:hypothetical protein
LTRERRAFTRIRLDVPASLFLYQVDMRHEGAITDLSRGGCYFPFSHQLPVGEKCRFQLTMGEGLLTEMIDIEGVIARSDGKGVGIQFVEMTPEVQAALARIMAVKGVADQEI